ncbi:HK97-gp10 family putative phage morphogenesis protein [Lysobacter korlensis]|uniref:HK97-gp10 family putative phage morphogenesis protein n=1 Tax=Lysobacter korlensis TaxID=553636 RepID=A0ABV6RKL2_9GAMM
MADTQTLRGLDDVLSKLRALPPEIVSKRGGVVKSALRKGGKVIADAAVRNINAITTRPETEEGGYVSTGILAKSVAVSRDPKPQQAGANERYRVHLRKRTYPDGTRTIATGRYLEFGTAKRAPTPWLQPAYMETRQQALETVASELGKGIDRAIKKMSRGA